MIKLSHFLVLGVLIVTQLFVQIKTQGPPPPNNVNRPADNPNRPPDDMNRPPDPNRPDERLQRPTPIPPPPIPPRPFVPMQGPPRPLPPPPPPRQNIPPFPPALPPGRPPIAVGFNPDRIRIEGFAPIQKRSMDSRILPSPSTESLFTQREASQSVSKRDVVSFRQNLLRVPKKIAQQDFVNELIGKKVKLTGVQLAVKDEERPLDDIPKKPFSETESLTADDSLAVDESIGRSLAEKLKSKFLLSALGSAQFLRAGHTADLVRVKVTQGVTLTPEAGFVALNQSTLSEQAHGLLNHSEVYTVTLATGLSELQLQDEQKDAILEDFSDQKSVQDDVVLEDQTDSTLDETSTRSVADTPLEAVSAKSADTVTLDRKSSGGTDDEEEKFAAFQLASTQVDMAPLPTDTVDPDEVAKEIMDDLVVVVEDEEEDQDGDEDENKDGDENENENEDDNNNETELEEEHAAADLRDFSMSSSTVSPTTAVDSEANKEFISLEEMNSNILKEPLTASALSFPANSAEVTNGSNGSGLDQGFNFMTNLISKDNENHPEKQALRPDFSSNISTNTAQSNPMNQATPTHHPQTEGVTMKFTSWWGNLWGKEEEEIDKVIENGKSEDVTKSEENAEIQEIDDSDRNVGTEEPNDSSGSDNDYEDILNEADESIIKEIEEFMESEERSSELDEYEDSESEDIIEESAENTNPRTSETTESIGIFRITVETEEEVVTVKKSPERSTIQYQTVTRNADRVMKVHVEPITEASHVTTPPILKKPVYDAYPTNIGRHNIINPTEGTLLARIVHFTQQNAGAVIGFIMGITAIMLMIYVLYLRCKRRRMGKLDISPGPLNNGPFPRFEDITKPRSCSVLGKDVVVDGCEEVALTEMGSMCQPKFNDSHPCQPKVLHIQEGAVGAF